MNKLKLLCLICFVCTASFAQSSDSTKQQVARAEQKTEMVISVKNDQKYLGKQVYIPKKKTTWTKIKDLFM